jgi:hypothetical protein
MASGDVRLLERIREHGLARGGCAGGYSNLSVFMGPPSFRYAGGRIDKPEAAPHEFEARARLCYRAGLQQDGPP